MHSLFSRIRTLSWRSLQLRLLLYLLLSGLIPLLFAMIALYSQSAKATDRELASSVRNTFGQMTGDVAERLNRMELLIRSVRMDPYVERVASSDALLTDLESAEFLRHMNEWVLEQKDYQPYVAEVCLSFDEMGVQYGPDRDLAFLQDIPLPVTGSDRYLELYNMGGRADTRLMTYTGAILHPVTQVVSGKVTVLIDGEELIPDDFLIYSGMAAVLIREKDSVSVQLAGDAGKPVMKELSGEQWSDQEEIQIVGGTVIASKPVDLLGERWSVIASFPADAFETGGTAYRTTLFVFLCALLFFSLLCSFAFSLHIAKPVQHLRSLMRRAESGDLKAYWTHEATQEINDLGESYNQMLNRLEETIKQVKREESLKKEAKMEALQYQLNPHFLYNTLNTIKWVAKIHKTPQISEAVSSLVRLLQASLGKKGDFLTLEEEEGLIRDYMEIQNFRYGETVRVEFDIEPEAYRCLVPRMILQPLVENALVHGFEHGMKDGVVIVRARLERDLLVCEVEDNGMGIREEEMPQSEERRDGSLKEKLSGIGLRHIREKIKLYYGQDYKLLIFNKETGGARVRLTLPNHQSEEING